MTIRGRVGLAFLSCYQNMQRNFYRWRFGRRACPTYNLLFIYADERIGESRQIKCATDEQVMAIASQEPGGHIAVQVWEGERPVGLVGNLDAAGQR
jgi:hypothetical protein